MRASGGCGKNGEGTQAVSEAGRVENFFFFFFPRHLALYVLFVAILYIHMMHPLMTSLLYFFLYSLVIELSVYIHPPVTKTNSLSSLDAPHIIK